jgi:fermentation-respiration switch protein FrsA (DUF1100 family)
MWLKYLIIFLSIVYISYILLCLALWRWQNRLIFIPPKLIEGTPAELGLPYEDVWLSVANEQGITEKIHAWWLPNQSSQEALLYLHGNGSNMSGNLDVAQEFYNLGFSLLLLDYRGYGLSEGKFPTEATVYQDAQLAWDYLVTDRGLKPAQIFVYGHSLGSAVAIDLGVRQPEMAGLITESSFTSILDVANNYGSFYRLFPSKILINQRFDSLSKVPLLQMPLLLIHGRDDQLIPVSMSEGLYAVAKPPKQLIIVPEAGHNDVFRVGGEKYLQAIKNFTQLVRKLALTP